MINTNLEYGEDYLNEICESDLNYLKLFHNKKYFKDEAYDDIEENLEEHRFLATCLKIGLRIEDLKELEYKDVAKMMLCFIEEKDGKKATQADIDKLLR